MTVTHRPQPDGRDMVRDRVALVTGRMAGLGAAWCAPAADRAPAAPCYCDIAAAGAGISRDTFVANTPGHGRRIIPLSQPDAFFTVGAALGQEIRRGTGPITNPGSGTGPYQGVRPVSLDYRAGPGRQRRPGHARGKS